MVECGVGGDVNCGGDGVGSGVWSGGVRWMVMWSGRSWDVWVCVVGEERLLSPTIHPSPPWRRCSGCCDPSGGWWRGRQARSTGVAPRAHIPLSPLPCCARVSVVHACIRASDTEPPQGEVAWMIAGMSLIPRLLASSHPFDPRCHRRTGTNSMQLRHETRPAPRFDQAGNVGRRGTTRSQSTTLTSHRQGEERRRARRTQSIHRQTQ